MNKMIVSSSPHVTSSNSVRKIMLDVVIALLPALTAAVLFFGWNALIIAVSCIAAAMAAEYLFVIIRNWKKAAEFAGKKNSVFDCSSVVTGLLVALNVPASFPAYWAALGSVFAIVVVKMLFGGIGKNFANPALVGRIFLFVSFGALMKTAVGTDGNLLNLTPSSGASWLFDRSPALVESGWLNMLVGNKASAAMGEVSIIAILIGFIYLTVRKVIDPRLPLTILFSTAVFAFLFDALPNAKGMDMLYMTAGHLLSGGLWLGAVFMATDYATSPNTPSGRFVFGVGIAFITVLIRVFGPLPEGMSFAIVIMNILVPIIDKVIVPRPFGYVKPPKVKKLKPAPAEAAAVVAQSAASVNSIPAGGSDPTRSPSKPVAVEESDAAGEKSVSVENVYMQTSTAEPAEQGDADKQPVPVKKPAAKSAASGKAGSKTPSKTGAKSGAKKPAASKTASGKPTAAAKKPTSAKKPAGGAPTGKGAKK